MILKLIKNILAKLSKESYTASYLMAKYENNETDLIITWYGYIKDILANQLFVIDKNLINLNRSIINTAQTTSFAFFLYDIMRVEFWFNWHHIEWCKLKENGQYISINASREIGKTYFWKDAYYCFNMFRCNEKSDIPELRQNSGLLVSETQAMSNEKMKDLKKIILNNPILKAKIYGDGKDIVWATENITTKTAYDLTAVGMDSAKRGKHKYHVVLDDVVPEGVRYSKDLRIKNIDVFKNEILPIVRIEEGGQIIVICTPRHIEDLTGYIKRDENVRMFFSYREYPAIMPNGQLTWAKKLSVNLLKQRRAIMGEVGFLQEYQCKVISENTTLFPYEILMFCKDVNYSYVNSIEEFKAPSVIEYVITGADLSISAKVGADETVFSTKATCSNGHTYMLNLYCEKGVAYKDQLNVIIDIDYRFKPNIIAIENNGFQDIYVQELKEVFTFATIHAIITGREKNDYIHGVPSMSLDFENRIIHYPYKTEYDRKITDMIFSQYNSIAFTDKGLKATSGHDDIIMAEWKCKQGLKIAQGSFNWAIIETNTVNPMS